MEASTVTWTGGNIPSGGITATEGNYAVDQGIYTPWESGNIDSDSQEASLTVSAAELENLGTNSADFTCSITVIIDNTESPHLETLSVSIFDPGEFILFIHT